MLAKNLLAILIVAMSCFGLLRFAESSLPQEEVDALEEIATTLGATYWKFNSGSCQIEMVGITPEPPKGSESSIGCECQGNNNTDCHVVKIKLRGYNLPGILPTQLSKLPSLREIDFALNYLYGTVPGEWGSLNLTSISLLVNRLSGEIPEELGTITTLTYLTLEANQFSGVVPPSLGGLSNLQTLMLSSNQLNRNLPVTFSGLSNLTYM